MKDKAGRTIKPGDIIVYGKALGRSAGMQYGKIIDIVEVEDRWRYTPTGKPKMTEKLQFIGIDDNWGNRKLLQKPSTLAFGDRILVVTRKQVNKAALKLLDTVDEKDHQE